MNRQQMKVFYDKHEKEILFAAVFLNFMVFYTLINALSVGREALDLRIGPDARIPIWPIFIPIYLSAYIMPFSAYFAVKDMRLFRRTIVACFSIQWISFITYLLFPAMIHRPELPPDSIWTDVFHWFHKIDPPYNSFPSLHVSQPILAAIVSTFANRKYWWLIVWAGLIAVSTLFTGQHVILDVIAGLILALIAVIFVIRKK